MIPMRSATTSGSAAFAPSSAKIEPHQDDLLQQAALPSAQLHRAGARPPQDQPRHRHTILINSPIASLECYISQPRVTGSNLSSTTLTDFRVHGIPKSLFL